MARSLDGLTPLLEVFDLPTSLAFYRNVLGFDMVSGDDTWWCMLKLGNATLMLNTAYEQEERPLIPEPQQVRGHGDLSLYFDTNPDEVYALLQSKGWQVTAPVEKSYGFRQVTTHDPDGFQLCFIRPSSRSADSKL